MSEMTGVIGRGEESCSSKTQRQIERDRERQRALLLHHTRLHTLFSTSVRQPGFLAHLKSCNHSTPNCHSTAHPHTANHTPELIYSRKDILSTAQPNILIVQVELDHTKRGRGEKVQ